MKLHASHGAASGQSMHDVDWFVVKPLDGQTVTSVAGTPITHDMAVASLVNAGRVELDLDELTVTKVQKK